MELYLEQGRGVLLGQILVHLVALVPRRLQAPQGKRETRSRREVNADGLRR